MKYLGNNTRTSQCHRSRHPPLTLFRNDMMFKSKIPHTHQIHRNPNHLTQMPPHTTHPPTGTTYQLYRSAIDFHGWILSEMNGVATNQACLLDKPTDLLFEWADFIYLINSELQEQIRDKLIHNILAAKLISNPKRYLPFLCVRVSNLLDTSDKILTGM